MADRSDKKEYRVKLDNTGGGRADMKGRDFDPGKEIKTRKSAAAAKQDMEFGEAMESDMNRYERDMERGRTMDEGWKDRPRYDGNKNLETGDDLTFTDKMYTPVVKNPEDAGRGNGPGKDNRSIELGEDNGYFWNGGDDRRSIEQRRSANKDNKEK